MRFTIRELVLVTVIVAVACGWFIERSRLIRQREDFKAKFLDSEGNVVSLIYFMGEMGVTVEKSPGGLSLKPNGEPAKPN